MLAPGLQVLGSPVEPHTLLSWQTWTRILPGQVHQPITAFRTQKVQFGMHAHP